MKDSREKQLCVAAYSGRKENERVRHVHPAPQAMTPSTPPARMASGAGIFQGGETTACPLSSATGLVQNRGTPKCVA